MKTLIKLVVFILVIASLVIVSFKPAILVITKKQLEALFTGASVTVDNCSVRLFSELGIYGIKIKKANTYDFSIREIVIDFSLKSLIKGTIRKVVLKGLNININTPQDSIIEFNKYLMVNRGKGVLINSAEIQQLELKVTAKDLQLKAFVSAVVNLKNNSIEYLKLNTGSLEMMGMRFENMVVNIPEASQTGTLFIKQVKYEKFKIETIKSDLKLIGQSLNLDNLQADIFGGKIEGNLKILLQKTIDYSLGLKAINLKAKDIIKDLNLQEKVQMTGVLGGDIDFKGNDLDFKFIKGDLALTEPGGDLTIKDTSFLENMAKNTNQSLDLLVEGFKNYRYNNGIVKLGLEDSNLVVSMLLDGSGGRRNVNIVLHDFSLVNLLKLQLKQ